MDPLLNDVQAELKRLNASEIQVEMDREFEPQAGALVKVTLENSYWHLMPNDFLGLLGDLPSGAGSSKVQEAIEMNATAVWHGPSPKDSRDVDAST